MRILFFNVCVFLYSFTYGQINLLYNWQDNSLVGSSAYDNTYNVAIGKLADTFNDLYRTAKSNQIFTDVNFKQELEFNGFFINSAAAKYYATTSDYKNSNFVKHLI